MQWWSASIFRPGHRIRFQSAYLLTIWIRNSTFWHRIVPLASAASASSCRMLECSMPLALTDKLEGWCPNCPPVGACSRAPPQCSAARQKCLACHTPLGRQHRLQLASIQPIVFWKTSHGSWQNDWKPTRKWLKTSWFSIAQILNSCLNLVWKRALLITI